MTPSLQKHLDAYARASEIYMNAQIILAEAGMNGTIEMMQARVKAERDYHHKAIVLADHVCHLAIDGEI